MNDLAEQNRVLRARVAELEAALEAGADPLLRSLLEQERSLRLAIEASRMGMWRWDVATSVVTWDDRLLEIWGIDAPPVDYASYLALVHPDDRALVDSVVTTAVTTGVYRSFEHRVAPTAERAERWLLAAGIVVKDTDGTPLRLMGGALDITEQKRLAAQLQRAERVESIGQLTAGIAHNFNNLLAAILPNVELALASSGESQRAGLTAARDAALQARELVRSLMTLTQRGGSLAQAPADPRDVVLRVEGICRVTFPREILIRHELPAHGAHVTMSVGDLEQVLLNLMFNARDAIETSGSEARTIDVLVDSEASAVGEPNVRIRVRDSGVGMPDDVRALVFEPFFTTKPPHKGSGLGLANVAARVRDAGGAISCESVSGAGSTFTLLLPPADRPAATAKQAPAPGSTKVGATILLVDDEPLVRTVLRRLLEREGYEIHEATSAAAARDFLKQPGAVCDLVILDQSMPLESGLHALPSMRALTRAPVVLFTGMAPEATSDVAAVLQKPAMPADLYRVVRDVLSRSS